MADDVAKPGDLVVQPAPMDVAKKSWTSWVSYLGLVAPELIDLALKFLDASPLAPETKNWMRFGALALIAVLRPIPQKNLSQPVLTKGALHE